MDVLILDNRDSFVHNLEHRFYELGANPIVYPSHGLDSVEIVEDGPDAICISPGPGHPRDAGISVEVIAMMSSYVPILGVCLGHQAIGVAFGGLVSPNGKPCHGRATEVTHNGHELFDGIPTTFEAGRYHSLSLEEPLPDRLDCIARGDGMVMAVALRDRPTFGVQFHPESILTPFGTRLLENFLHIARRY